MNMPVVCDSARARL